MSKYTPQVQFATEFDGDKVSMRLARLKRKHVVLMAPFMSGETDVDGNDIISFKDEVQLSEVMSKILPEVVTEFSGLVDAEGVAIELTVAVDDMYFSELVAVITKELFTISRPGKEEIKDIKKPSSDTGIESDTTQQQAGSSVATP